MKTASDSHSHLVHTKLVHTKIWLNKYKFLYSVV